MGSLFFALLVVPAVELWLLARIASVVGFLPVFGYTLLAALAGFSLALAEGQRAMRDFSADLGSGRVPQNTVISGVLVLLSALLLIVPGVITDVCAALLLLPVTRRVITSRVGARMGVPPAARSATNGRGQTRGRSHRDAPRTEVGRVFVREGDVIDTTGEEVDP